jgi:predicted SAM-dependent methyltransferase
MNSPPRSAVAHEGLPSGFDEAAKATLTCRVIRSLKALFRAVIGKGAYAAIGRRLPRRSETSRYRHLLKEFCAGYGIDIGFGGDPIAPSAIRMDLPAPYTKVGEASVQFGGDCRDLYWLRDGVLDYVYSSHVLEDFPSVETSPILQEWTRVIRPGGRLILLLPDQQRYLKYCRRSGQVGPDGIVGNPHHAIPTFSLRYVDQIVNALRTMKKIACFEALGPYSFAIVYEKQS